MSYQAPSPLERMLRECELGWMIDWYEPPDQSLPHLRQSLADATQEATGRFGAGVLSLTEDDLATEYQANPHKVRAFLQALGTTRSPVMLVMAWRILQGIDVALVDLQYEMRARFNLRVTLRNSYDGRDEMYESNNINDAAMLRHFGITTIDNAPLFDGFFPLRLA